MKSFVFVSTCIYVLTSSAAEAVEPQKFPSQAAALAALTAPKPLDGVSAGTGAAVDDDIEEIPVDTPTISDVQRNTPVAGETGQL